MSRGLAAIALLLALSGSAAAGQLPLEPGAKLGLRRAIAIALERHPARLAEISRLGAAKERIGEARSAYQPQVYGSAEYLRATDNGIGTTAYLTPPGLAREPARGATGARLADTFDNVLGSISAFQYLFDFGRTSGLVAQRDAEADAENARLRLVELDLAYDVAKAYFDLVAAREIVKVYQTAVAQRTEHLRDAEVKARAGLRPEIDTYTAKAELARAEMHLADARNAAGIAKVTLDEAMGLGENAPEYAPSDELRREEIPATLDRYVAEAIAARPDLAMLVDEARAAGAEIREVRSDYFPSFGAAAGYDVRGHGSREIPNAYAGVLVRWPLFNGGLTAHEVEEARLRQEAVRHSIDDLRQRIFVQVKSAFLDWQGSLDRITQAEQTLAASRAELDLAQKRYDAGLGSIIELTDAQRRFTEDGAQSVKALADSATAKAALGRAVGGELPAL